MKAARFGIAVAVAFLFGAHLALAQSGDAAAGKAIYDRTCATCHGPDGTPKDAVARMLKVEMRHLGSKEVQAKGDAEIRRLPKDAAAEGRGKGCSQRDRSSPHTRAMILPGPAAHCGLDRPPIRIHRPLSRPGAFGLGQTGVYSR